MVHGLRDGVFALEVHPDGPRGGNTSDNNNKHNYIYIYIYILGGPRGDLVDHLLDLRRVQRGAEEQGLDLV